MNCRCCDNQTVSQKPYWYLSMHRRWHAVIKHMNDEKAQAAKNKIIVQEARFRERGIIWRRFQKSADRAQGTDNCRVFHHSRRKTPSLEPHYFISNQILWCEKVSEFRYGYRFSVSCFAEEELEEYIQPEIKVPSVSVYFQQVSILVLLLTQWENYSTIALFTTQKKQDLREPGPLKEWFRCTELLCADIKTCCFYEVTSNIFKWIAKVSINLYSNRVVRDLRKMSPGPGRECTHNVNEHRFL